MHQLQMEKMESYTRTAIECNLQWNMSFAEAFKRMKAGSKVKLPSWGGFWYWDTEKETIMMQCRDKDNGEKGDLLDIRDTKMVEYTLNNILSNEWLIAE